MCGICGILRFKGYIEVDSSIIKRMDSTLTHRGPDDSGIYVGNQICLGHKRLSIIDIAGGHQPMKSDTHGALHAIVYNGEIYNYLDLKRELVGIGYQFTSKSDTEVILNAYKEWGEQSVKRFRGMFSFGIWDGELKRLFLARDRMGIKPLYYYRDDEIFIFASEIKAILASGFVQSSLEYSALDSFLTLGYVPGPMTMFTGIDKLLPGHSITINYNGKKEIKSYWNFNKIRTRNISFYDAQAKLVQQLKDSVKMCLMSEVPLGVFLSGGLDSSAITALMYEMTDKKINTFSVGYEGAEEANELSFARKVADLFETEHHEFILKPYDFFDSIPELVRMTEEPLVEMSAIPLYQISKMAKSYATVLLSGEGSDEVFAGYGLYQRMLNMDKVVGMTKCFGLIPNSCLPGDKLKKYADWLSSSVADRYRGISCDSTERIKRSFYSPDFLKYTQENDCLD